MQNPLERFDVTALWDDEHDGDGHGGHRSQLGELIVLVDEELARLTLGDDSEGPSSERTDDRQLREQRLEQILQQQTFSHSFLDDNVRRLRRGVSTLEHLQKQPSSAFSAIANAGRLGRASGSRRPSLSTAAHSSAHTLDQAVPVPVAEPLGAGTPASAAAEERAAAALAEDAVDGGPTREDALAAHIGSLHERALSFANELVDVSGWLEDRRLRETDAIDRYREQVILRADGGPVESGDRRAGRRQPTAPSDPALALESEAIVAEEVSARAESLAVLEGIDGLESSLHSTLGRFGERLSEMRPRERRQLRDRIEGVDDKPAAGTPPPCHP